MKEKKRMIIVMMIIITIVIISVTLMFNLVKICKRKAKINKIEVSDIINDKYVEIEQEEIFDSSKIGTLTIPKLDLFDVEICESVELETLSYAIGHFENTSIYEGNVGLASHNAGTSANYFAKINKLNEGDEIFYTTKYGTKKYKVNEINTIYSTDWSKLEQNGKNMITLITCISGMPDMRLCVQAIEDN